MAADDNEEKLLRSVALRNAHSILVARQRAELALVQANEALERKTEELAHSLAMMRATLESTTDGILVTNASGGITDFNQNFVEMWRLPQEVMGGGDHRQLLELTSRQFDEPEIFRARIDEIYAASPPESFDLLKLSDGRVFEGFSRIQFVEERNVGRVWSFRDITERKRAEEELEQQREWFQVTLSSIGDAVITTDTQGNVTFLNPVAEMMTGWKTSEASGVPLEKVFNIINENTREPAQNPVDKVLRQGSVVGLTNHTALIARDGTERGIEDSAAPIRDANGNISGIVMVFHDVTARRGAENALRASEDRLRATFNQAAVGMATAGLDGRFEQVNQRFTELLGYSGEECYRLTFADVTYPDDLPEMQANVARLMAGEIADYAMEKRYVRKNGSVVWSLTSVTLLRDTAGRPQRFIGAIEDISQRKEAEEERWQLTNVLEKSLNEIYVFDAETLRFEYVNGGALRNLGYTLEQLRQMTPLDIKPKYTETSFREMLEPLLAQEQEKLVFYTVHRRADGSEYPVEVHMQCVARGDKRVFLAIILDITQREYAEEALREAGRRKDQFLATLAHELRNPLVPIRNGLKILQLAGNDAAMAENARSMMDQALDQMVRLVDDLLDMSRITTGKLQLRKERVALAVLVQSAIATSRPLIAEQDHELTVALPAAPILLDADPTRMAQVFSNLLNNAAKYSERGAHITLSAERQGNEVAVRVMDTGIGIAAAELPRIFEMFTQADVKSERSREGLGIGLSLVKGLVEMHGGRIEAHSDGLGMGSAFTVRLPVVMTAGSSTARPETGDGDRPSTGERHRILIVDDNRLSCKSTAMALQIMGHEVATAQDGIEGTAYAATFRPDVILLDIGLPGLNGHETARRIREQPWGKGIFLIAVTGYGQEEDRRRSLEAGFDYHMVKPVNFTELNTKLAELSDAVRR